MGATDFETRVENTAANEAFREARQRYEGQSRESEGYSGTVAEKHSYKVINGFAPVTMKEAREVIDAAFEDDDHDANDKYAAAQAIRVKQRKTKNAPAFDGWVFFGCASC